MARKVDITEKLSFDENPVLVIKGQELEVNTDAETMLKVIAIMQEENEASAMIEVYELLFDEETRDRIRSMNLKFKDLRKVIAQAIHLLKGDDTEGELETQATT